MKYLITGFGPFGSLAINPTAQMARDLDGLPSVVGIELPTSYERAPAVLADAIKTARPDRVIMLGWAEGAHGLRIERVARRSSGNRLDIDNEPAPAVQGAPEVRPTLDPDSLARMLSEAGEVSFSDNAGEYVCNFLYYGFLRDFPQIPGIFIHVSAAPGTPEYVKNLAALSHLVA